MTERFIKKIDMEPLGVGESTVGPADGVTVLSTRTYSDLNGSGRSRIYRMCVDDTEVPDDAYYKAALQLQSNLPDGLPFLVTDAVFGGAPHSDAIFARIQANGGDLRMFEETGLTTPMPVDLVSINAAGDAIQYWSKSASAKSTSSNLFVRYDNLGTPLTQPAADATSGSEEVWADYQFASHDPVFDVSGNYTPTNTGTVLSATGGPFGGPCRGFGSTHGTGASDKIAMGHSTRPSVFSFSAWVYVTGTGNRIILGNAGASTQLRRHSSGALEFLQFWDGGGGEWRGGTISLNTWTHVAVIYDTTSASNDPELYINGAPVSLSVDTNGSGTISGLSTWYIGSNAYDPEGFEGFIAETRFYPADVGATWVAAEYANHANAASLLLAQAEAAV